MDEDSKILAGTLGTVCAFALIAALAMLPASCMPGCGYAGKVVDVVSQELDPHVLLQRYNWFKDAAAMLEKKQADMKVYDRRLTGLEHAYEGKTRREWARDDREQWSIWSSEAAGVRASYNSLCAEYNAAMSKEQWRFCEIGRLPPGAAKPLPREYKPYEEQ